MDVYPVLVSWSMVGALFQGPASQVEEVIFWFQASIAHLDIAEDLHALFSVAFGVRAERVCRNRLVYQRKGSWDSSYQDAASSPSKISSVKGIDRPIKFFQRLLRKIGARSHCDKPS
jgi:hypothetical protein